MNSNETAMKKVIVINGSPKKDRSSTMNVTRAFVKGIEETVPCEVEYIHLSEQNVKPCTGCLSCWGRTEGECVIKDDDIPSLKDKILQADYVIESYPLYFFGMPGTMKVFTDRMLSMLCTYRGQKAPEEGESFHGIRQPKKKQQFVVISSCAYSAADAIYDSLLKQYDCICGKDGYTAILCPQLKTLVDLGASSRMDRYMKQFTEAGKKYASEGALSDADLAKLSKAPFTQGTYEVLLAEFWKGQKEGEIDG